MRRAAARGLLTPGGTLVVDSTGLEARHASRHYEYRYSPRYQQAYAALHAGRAPAAPHARPRYPKLSAGADAGSHLILGLDLAWGPANDSPGFAPVVRQASALWPHWHALAADRGYDAEAAHVLARETLGIACTAIPLNPRTTGRAGPRGRWRRLMWTAFPAGAYRQRRQIESVFSRLKRRLGAALTARRADTQHQELALRVLTHNLLLLWRAWGSFQQSQ